MPRLHGPSGLLADVSSYVVSAFCIAHVTALYEVTVWLLHLLMVQHQVAQLHQLLLLYVPHHLYLFQCHVQPANNTKGLPLIYW